MCNRLVCEVCGGQGVNQIEKNAFTVVMCPEHFNQLHINLQEKKPRLALIKFHLASVLRNNFLNLSSEETEQGFGKIVVERLNNWMDAEHEYFLATEEIVDGMKKEWEKKNKKKNKANPRPEPSDDGELILKS